MTKKRLQPALTLWQHWQRIAFTGQTLLQKKQHTALCAPEYDPSEEDNIVLLSGEKALPEIPKKIWMYWDNEYLPKSMALNIQQLRQDNPDHQVYVLNRLTLKEVLPDFIFTSTQLSEQQKSEVIRLELLLRYGGIAIDCSTLLFEDLSWVHRAHQERRMDVIGYYREIATVNYLAPVIENWFLAAAPNNPFIREWQKQYAPIKHLGAHNYFNELAKRDDFALLTQKIAEPAQQLGSLAQQAAMREHRRVNLYLRKCEANAYYYQRLNNWQSDAFAHTVLFHQRPHTPPPVIKLSGIEQLHLDFNLRLGNYNRRSLLGAMMQPSTPLSAPLASPINKARA
ncbi:mannosyltransferase [Pantoea sp. Ap-870]|uniref:glycosyltransferase family 32 protein n=1 Tax=Pantoea sp. Ap-870 TaxID=2608358 RepID=UPI001419F5F5|nr:capsular polysaccharide synthesis protein [Pantoea sp. Ap-870]NIE52562.1 mannosyltransferase [Pantoea sp. Ap-870]